MKSMYLRSIVALACAATLAACGGKGGDIYLGGSVVGLSKTGLTLTNGSTTLAVAAGASSFNFAQTISADSDYNVTIKDSDQPKGAKCTVINGKGKASTFNVTTVLVSCLTDQYTLGGSVSGLDAGQSITLVNAPDSLEVKANGAFTFTQTVGDGSTYVVSVLPASVPANKTCTVPNGSGTMGSANQGGLNVACVNK
ncbi:hypothetical protein [Janthinobacterium sp.]|uniref:hypothetical protein n=1 Tax=Janthinobacterium sp. TaxID=1871054 RepID=UPI00293D3F43|nr:hypothetical protein [Janthinobacterium sp.]